MNKDFLNVIFLTFLYFLQSVPLGLIGSLPYILSARSVSYAEQAIFSFAFWPFSIKLLWAPIVDSIYSKFIGKRKSWLIPVQYLIGIMLILTSDYVKQLLDSQHNLNNNFTNIQMLTIIFFGIAFLAATQDVVVDGWSLTMFSNPSLGSTCESTGGTAGWFVGNVLFLVFESADFSNAYIRPFFGLENQSHGIVTIRDFMIFFGFLYILTTTLIILFKREPPLPSIVVNQEEQEELNLTESYALVWKILKLKPIQCLILVVLSMRLCFGAESMVYLKLVEAGIPKEKMGLLTIPLTPLQFILPFFIGKMLKNQSSFKFMTHAILFRSLITGWFAFWVYVTPWFKNTETNQFDLSYWLITIFFEGLHSVSFYASYMPMMYFFTSISDKNYGATYLTFFNTINNLSRSFTSTSNLYIANFLTSKTCSNSSSIKSDLVNKCVTDLEKEACSNMGGKCVIEFDSFYLQAFVGLVLTIGWLIWIRKSLDKLEKLPKSEWIVYQNKIKLK